MIDTSRYFTRESKVNFRVRRSTSQRPLNTSHTCRSAEKNKVCENYTVSLYYDIYGRYKSTPYIALKSTRICVGFY